MIAKLVLAAALVGALSGMFAATGGALLPHSSEPQAHSSAGMVARVEAAWNASRHHGAR